MHSIRRLILVALGVFLSIGFASAHQLSSSYLTLRVDGTNIRGQWDIALRDLDHAIGLDANGDGEITWGELRSRHDEVAAYALARLGVQNEAGPCPTRAIEHLADNHSDGAYAVLRFVATCPGTPGALSVAYNMFFDVDPLHKGLLRLEYQGRTTSAIFDPERPSQRFGLEGVSGFFQFLDFGRHGVWHIWIGFDHILFLLALLLPAVLYRESNRWLAVARFREAFWDVFKIVTSFTVAHSITLSLAALEVVTIPSRIAESAIAVSVLLAALNNLYPVVTGRRWLVAFLFGLVHGFGFASALSGLGLPPDSLVVALLGFNLGVEVGQLAIVGLFIPIAYRWRQTLFYQRFTLQAGSLLIAMLALLWLVERVFDVSILPL
jgi:hypothetical protein